MKTRSCLICILAAIIGTVVSCSDRDSRVHTALEAADSLMMSSPEAALDTLYGLDSSSIRRMDRGGRALYTLLRTEAEYKCYLPVAEDTAIFDATDYYRRKGREDLLARALMMEGAVYVERDEPVQALVSYKEAEPIFERDGDLEQLGLINTRIGEHYQHNVVDVQSAIERFTRALECFEQAGLDERVMSAHLSLARMMANDSAEAAKRHVEIIFSHTDGNDGIRLSAYELLAQILYYEENFPLLLKITQKALKEYSTDIEYANSMILDNLCALEAVSYARLGRPDSARKAWKNITVTQDAAIRLRNFWVEDEIAQSENDWKEAYRIHCESGALADSVAEA